MKNTAPSPNHLIRANVLRSLIRENGIGAEIGVHKGTFSRSILNTVKPQQLHLIDPWYLMGKEWRWGEGNRSTMDALINILQAFEDELINKTIVLHIGYDLEVLMTFPDDYFDWVYLDSSHQYEQTKKELALLKLKVKKEGVIAGDDWYNDPEHRHHGVYLAIQEFVEHEPYEIIYADNQNKQWALKQIQDSSQ